LNGNWIVLFKRNWVLSNKLCDTSTLSVSVIFRCFYFA